MSLFLRSASRLRSIDARSLAQIYMGLSQVIFKYNDNFLDLGPGSGNSFATASLVLDNPNCFGIELNRGAQEFYLKNYSFFIPEIKSRANINDASLPSTSPA